MPSPIKKEFVTYWSQETVIPLEQMSLSRERYHDRVAAREGRPGHNVIIRPDDIAFGQLAVFAGKKTRVTIEIID